MNTITNNHPTERRLLYYRTLRAQNERKRAEQSFYKEQTTPTATTSESFLDRITYDSDHYKQRASQVIQDPKKERNEPDSSHMESFSNSNRLLAKRQETKQRRASVRQERDDEQKQKLESIHKEFYHLKGSIAPNQEPTENRSSRNILSKQDLIESIYAKRKEQEDYEEEFQKSSEDENYSEESIHSMEEDTDVDEYDQNDDEDLEEAVINFSLSSLTPRQHHMIRKEISNSPMLNNSKFEDRNQKSGEKFPNSKSSSIGSDSFYSYEQSIDVEEVNLENSYSDTKVELVEPMEERGNENPSMMSMIPEVAIRSSSLDHSFDSKHNTSPNLRSPPNTLKEADKVIGREHSRSQSPFTAATNLLSSRDQLESVFPADSFKLSENYDQLEEMIRADEEFEARRNTLLVVRSALLVEKKFFLEKLLQIQKLGNDCGWEEPLFQQIRSQIMLFRQNDS